MKIFTIFTNYKLNAISCIIKWAPVAIKYINSVVEDYD